MGERTRGQDVAMSRDGEKAKVPKGIHPLGTRDVCAVSFAAITMSRLSVPSGTAGASAAALHRPDDRYRRI